jgi:hypothetical protein
MNFERVYREGIKPYSKEWFKERGTINVGCSQLGIIMFKNKNEERALERRNNLVRDFIIKRKGGIVPFDGHVPCGWGVTFEHVVVKIIEEQLGSKVYCRNIYINNIPQIPLLRCSPDGVIRLCCTSDGNPWMVTMDPSAVVKITCALIEIKCPLNRWPNGDVPEEYIPQIQGGMVATKKLNTEGLFIDALFRICAMEDHGNTPNYNLKFHGGKKCGNHNPIAWGVLEILDKRIVNHENDEKIDYGEKDKKTIEQLLTDINDRKFYSSVLKITFQDGKCLDFSSNDKRCVGYLTFKLFKIYYRTLVPDPNFCEVAKESIEKFFEDIRKNENS